MNRRVHLWAVGFVGIACMSVCGQEFPDGPSGPPADCPDTFATDAVFKVVTLDGMTVTLPGLSDPATKIGRSDPFAEGDAGDAGAAICNAGFPDTEAFVADACRRPAGFPEGSITRREVHTELLSLVLTGGGNTMRAGQPYFDSVDGTPQARFFKNSIGEVASLDPTGTPANDFPADSFFNVFIEVELSTGVKLYNKTPMVVRSTINAFPPGFVLPQGYVHEPSFSAVALFDADGLPFGYLLDAAHGASGGGAAFVGDARLALPCPASFSVDDMTLGLDPAMTMVSPNDVFADGGMPEQQVTVYFSSGASPGGLPDMTNARDAALTGGIGPGPMAPSFMMGDAINSFSYGRDGTVGFLFFPPICPVLPGPGTLYFSVSRSSEGATCTDVWQNSRPAFLEQAADIYASAAPPFGSYDGPPGFPAPVDDNILAADNTHLGLRPGPALPQDNVTGLELKIHANEPLPKFFYGTFVGPSFGNLGDGARVFVFDSSVPPFDPASFVTFADPVDLGLVNGDVIDALALSDVDPEDPPFPCFPVPNGLMDPDKDDVLFSLAPGSPTLAAGGFSAADIFFSDFDGSFVRYAKAASLGLLATDDVDGIDIKPIEQCDFKKGGGCPNGVVDPGACCTPTSCVDVAEDTCLVIGGTFNGIGTSCADDPPPCRAIPVTSEWGLVVMALLILTVATVILRGRRRWSALPG